MSDENVYKSDISEPKDNVSQKEIPFKSLEEAMAEIEKLKSINKEVIASRDEVKSRLRAIESSTEETIRKALEEQKKFKDLFEASESKRIALESAVRERELSSVLRSELISFGALSVDTVMKLINKNEIEFNEDGSVKVDSVRTVIKELKKSDPILFGTEKTPEPKRAGDGDNVSTFEVELRKAKTQKEVEAILQKFGKK